MNIYNFLYDDFKLDKNKPIKLFEAFSGIGTQAMALKRLGVDLKHVGISEIDKFALESYKFIHGNVKNYGSIVDIKGKDLPEIDIFTYSFPCQDLSKAGKGAGLQGDTRSGLVYETIRVLEEMEQKPKVLLMENVPDLLNQNHKEGWREIYLEIEKMGYSNYVEILNARDYGVPQNRRRVFMVSILGDYNYNFPKPFDLKLRLKDMLEDDVDEKYFLSDKMVDYITADNAKWTGNNDKAIINKDIASTINTGEGSRRCDASNYISNEVGDSFDIKEATKQGYKKAYDGDGVYINRPHQKRGVVQKDSIQTIKTSPDVGVVVKSHKNFESENYYHVEEVGSIDNARRVYKQDKHAPTLTSKSENAKVLTDKLRIRKLTPREAWRLMGIKDSDFDKVDKHISDSQLYKQAGNSIVVDVLYYIFKELLK